MSLRAGRSVCSNPNPTVLTTLCINFEQLLEKTITLVKEKQSIKGVKENEGKNTITNTHQILTQLNSITDLHDPIKVRKTIIDAKHQKTKEPLATQTKRKWQLFYEYFCQANEIKGYEHIKFKIIEQVPIIPSKSQVERVIAAAHKRYQTIFTIMVETGAEGEEIHRTNRNMIDIEQGTITIKGVKGHDTKNYKLKHPTQEMIKEYLAKYRNFYPFPAASEMSDAWRTARRKVAEGTKCPEIKKIQMRNLRNYSGAQYYLSMPVRDPIDVMRHLRHKKIERTMHYIRAIVLPLEEDIEFEHVITHNYDEEGKAIDNGWTLVRAINETTALYKKRKA